MELNLKEQSTASPNGTLQSGTDVTAKLRQLNEIIKSKTSATEEKVKPPFKRKIVLKNVAVYVAGHAFALWGLYRCLQLFPLWHVPLVGIPTAYINMVGVQIGAHRYYTHRTFKASTPLKILMLISMTISSQNCMWVWVRDHRQHHKYSDTDADPHNASNGFFFSHVGWLLSKKHPDVIEKGKGIDMSDLDADPLVQFQKKYYTILWIVLAVALPTMIPVYVFGYPWVLALASWGAFRIVMSLNITWLVNSWAHLIGTKPFDKNIKPVETAYIPWMLMGEGWHNYHHTFPWDYNASEYGMPHNPAGSFIRFCARMGHAWDLRTASEEIIYKRAEKTGDGTPYLAKLNIERPVNLKKDRDPEIEKIRESAKSG